MKRVPSPKIQSSNHRHEFANRYFSELRKISRILPSESYFRFLGYPSQLMFVLFFCSVRWEFLHLPNEICLHYRILTFLPDIKFCFSKFFRCFLWAAVDSQAVSEDPFLSKFFSLHNSQHRRAQCRRFLFLDEVENLLSLTGIHPNFFDFLKYDRFLHLVLFYQVFGKLWDHFKLLSIAVFCMNGWWSFQGQPTQLDSFCGASQIFLFLNYIYSGKLQY